MDLAAEPRNTALVTLEWAAGTVTVRSIDWPADDEAVVAACAAADKIGIDCPLGWPDDFVAFVSAHRAGRPVATAGTIEQRRALAYRATDVHCQALGMRPLSVSADRIGHAAFRCAALLPRLGAADDRSGAGRVVETYPAGSLRQWSTAQHPFALHGYKGRSGAARLAANVAVLQARLPLRFADETMRPRVARIDHVFDAVVAAVTARAAAVVGGVDPVPDVHARRARVEGWIAVPTADSLSRLL